MLDRDEIQRGLNSLSTSQRQDIEQRAKEQAIAMETRYPRLANSSVLDAWNDTLIDQLVTDFAELPCPALQPDGSCSIYEFRPVTCRTMGIPSEDHGLVQGACEIQTAVPLIQLSRSLRKEETMLAEKETLALTHHAQRTGQSSEELLLPYGFLADVLNRGRETLEPGDHTS